MITQLQIPPETLAAFGSDKHGEAITVKHVDSGLINHTYVISSSYHSPYLLQKINTTVFPDPVAIQENYVHIWQHISSRIPAPKFCNDHTTLFVDNSGHYWRACQFIGDAKTLLAAGKKEEAASTAKVFAEFTASLEDFDINLLKEVIPGFHNLGFRYNQWEEVIARDSFKRKEKSLRLIDELKKREPYKHFYDVIITSKKDYPKRVMHHDAKIANVLFNRQTGEVICPVDFDTVMPGYFFSDLGDMIRTMTCAKEENSTAFKELTIRKEFYEAIISTYETAMNHHLTPAEKKHIHSAGLLMIYMQSLRFFTDYLNGDNYYRIDYPEHNLNRSVNQLTLLQNLEAFLKKEYGFSLL